MNFPVTRQSEHGLTSIFIFRQSTPQSEFRNQKFEIFFCFPLIALIDADRYRIFVAVSRVIVRRLETPNWKAEVSSFVNDIEISNYFKSRKTPSESEGCCIASQL